MRLKSKQQGLSFLGIVFLIIVLIVFGALGLRLYPLYYEKFQVSAALRSVAERPDAADLTPSQVRTYFLRNIEISSVRRFTSSNIKQHLKILKGKKGEPNKMRLTYDAENKFVADLFFIMRVNETVPLGK